MKTEEEIAAEKVAAEKAAEEARKKAEIKAQEEAEAEAERKKRAPVPDPNPRGQDVTKALLDEWDEFKKDMGWIPKSKRPAPVSEKQGGPCCILHPFCLCESKKANASA